MPASRHGVNTRSVLLFSALLLASCGTAHRAGRPGGTPQAEPEPTATTTAAENTGSATATPSPAPSGPTAPDFSLPSLGGKTVRLSDHLGKDVILLDFWHTTCHPCIQEMPELVKLQKRYRDRGFVVLGISTDGPETRADVTAVIRDHKIDFPILLDEETAVQDRYNPKGELPFTVLIDRRGAIVLKRSSYQAGDEKSMKQLVDAIEQALAAK